MCWFKSLHLWQLFCSPRKLMHSAIPPRQLCWSSGQDGGIARNPWLPCTTKSRITTNLKSINKQKHQKIKLHGTLTTKELKKKSTRLVRQTSRADSEKPRRGGWGAGLTAKVGGLGRQGWLKGKTETQLTVGQGWGCPHGRYFQSDTRVCWKLH